MPFQNSRARLSNHYVEGLTSVGVELDMDSSDDLLALRDALAESERLRREARAWDDAAERSRRLRQGFFGEPSSL